MFLKKTVALSLLMLSIASCSLVELTPDGTKTRILSASEVTKCTYLGKTTSSTDEKLLGNQRHDNVVKEELMVLARNSAVTLGGDTVVVDGPIVEGTQIFKVYRCLPQ